jgi:hypothetical protein
MTTIDIDETIRNAILAALDERAVRLDAEVARWQWEADLLGDHNSETGQRALVWNIAALHETNMARLLVGEAGEPDLPVCPCYHAHALCTPDCHAAPAQTLAEAVPWEPAGKDYWDWVSGR